MAKITELTHCLLKYWKDRGEAVQCNALPHLKGRSITQVYEAGNWRMPISMSLYRQCYLFNYTFSIYVRVPRSALYI